MGSHLGVRVGLLALILAACTGSTSPPTTTIPLAVPEVSTSVVSAGTIVPFESGRPTLFEQGQTYRQDALLVPFEVRFSEVGWRSDLSREQLVAFLNTDGTSMAAAVSIWVDGTTPNELMASVSEMAERVDGPTPRTVGGLDGELIDVHVGPQQIDSDNQRDHPCDNAWDFKADPGIGEISQFERKQLGTLAACGWSRVWFGSLGDEQMIVIGISRFDASPGDPGELADLAPHDEDFLNAIVFCIGSRCSP